MFVIADVLLSFVQDLFEEQVVSISLENRFLFNLLCPFVVSFGVDCLFNVVF